MTVMAGPQAVNTSKASNTRVFMHDVYSVVRLVSVSYYTVVITSTDAIAADKAISGFAVQYPAQFPRASVALFNHHIGLD